MTLTRDITLDEIERYERDGAICLRGLFNAAWIERMCGAIDRLLDSERARRGDLTAPGGTGRFNNGSLMWRFDPDFRAFVFESPAAEIARQIMRSRTSRFLYDHMFVKEPQTKERTPWHHDQPYWPVRGEQICSVWLSLDTVTKETSGLEYIKGSHRWPSRYRPEVWGNGAERWRMLGLLDSLEEAIPDIDAARDKYEFLSWDVEPGDCLVHHSLAIHGSSGNASSTQRRRAHATRWLGDDAVYAPAPGSFNLLLDETLTPGKPLDSERFPCVIGS
jgi:ectoine hydroxylase-related dioxygenase (phytanoyl-CoA dioxygenase family)